MSVAPASGTGRGATFVSGVMVKVVGPELIVAKVKADGASGAELGAATNSTPALVGIMKSVSISSTSGLPSQTPAAALVAEVVLPKRTPGSRSELLPRGSM
jgi:hypothetical protein